MKVLLLNGSPKANGNTAYALSQMAEVFTAEGVETEIMLPQMPRWWRFWIGCFTAPALTSG